MNAPTSPAKFAGGCVAPLLKNHTGSVGSQVTSETTQSRATANRATPRNSLARREREDAVTVSDLHDDGQDQRAPPGSPLQKPSQLDAHLLAQQAGVRPFLDARGFNQ